MHTAHAHAHAHCSLHMLHMCPCSAHVSKQNKESLTMLHRGPRTWNDTTDNMHCYVSLRAHLYCRSRKFSLVRKLGWDGMR